MCFMRLHLQASPARCMHESTSTEVALSRLQTFGLQAQRKQCMSCTTCPGFQIWFRACDANDPDVMLHCSVCGCSAHLHQVDQVRQMQ